jgi:hypothetical protein
MDWIHLAQDRCSSCLVNTVVNFDHMSDLQLLKKDTRQIHCNKYIDVLFYK